MKVRFLATTVLILVAAGCSRVDPRLESLANMEAPPVTASERIRELKELISDYESVVSEKIDAALQQAFYLKLLALEYMRQALYGPAFNALEEAILIEPQNAILHYYAGASSGYLAKAQAQIARRDDYFAIAERYYLRAIELDPNYKDALYGLSVLYVFELGRPDRAIPLLDRLLERSPANSSALFVLARAYAALGNIDDAVTAYEEIIATAADTDLKELARRNRQLLLGGGQ